MDYKISGALRADIINTAKSFKSDKLRGLNPADRKILELILNNKSLSGTNLKSVNQLLDKINTINSAQEDTSASQNKKWEFIKSGLGLGLHSRISAAAKQLQDQKTKESTGKGREPGLRNITTPEGLTKAISDYDHQPKFTIDDYNAEKKLEKQKEVESRHTHTQEDSKTKLALINVKITKNGKQNRSHLEEIYNFGRDRTYPNSKQLALQSLETLLQVDNDKLSLTERLVALGYRRELSKSK